MDYTMCLKKIPKSIRGEVYYNRFTFRPMVIKLLLQDALKFSGDSLSPSKGNNSMYFSFKRPLSQAKTYMKIVTQS